MINDFITSILTPQLIVTVQLIILVFSILVGPYILFAMKYSFNQKKGIKETLSHSKTPLVKAAEELNHRLCKFSYQIANQWHVKEKKSGRNLMNVTI